MQGTDPCSLWALSTGIADQTYGYTTAASYPPRNLRQALFVDPSAQRLSGVPHQTAVLIATSDESGIVTFENIVIARALPRQYSFVFQAIADGREASTVASLSVTTDVAALIVRFHTSEFQPFVRAEFGEPLQPQPLVRVVDASGNAVPGKIVCASVSEPSLQQLQFLSFVPPSILFPQAGILSGDCSPPTDMFGYTLFSNLTVVQSAFDVLPIVFHTDGVLSSGTLLRFPSAVSRNTQESLRLEVLVHPESEITEGQAFVCQPSVRVVNSDGEPVVGVVIFASIDTEAGVNTQYMKG